MGGRLRLASAARVGSKVVRRDLTAALPGVERAAGLSQPAKSPNPCNSKPWRATALIIVTNLQPPRL